MKLQFTAKGIAALWLRGHAPNSEQSDIDALSLLIEGIWADGLKGGMEHAQVVVSKSPTLSAAQATLEADVADLKQKYRQEQKDELDFDLTKYAKTSIDPLLL